MWHFVLGVFGMKVKVLKRKFYQKHKWRTEKRNVLHLDYNPDGVYSTNIPELCRNFVEKGLWRKKSEAG